MFDAVLHTGNVPKRRLGTGALISAAAHAAVCALVLYASARPIIKQIEAPEVMLRVAPPPPPPPPPPGGPSVPRTEAPKKPKPVKTELAIPREPVKEVKEQPHEESTEEPQPGGEPGGVPGGVPGGIPGGEVGGTGTALAPATQAPPPPPPPPTNAVIPFGAGMERPRLMAGSPPGYSNQARAAKVEGTVLVKCVITTSGSLRDCRIIKGLPFLDEQVLATLASQRYTPVTFQGRPVDVEYVLSFKFKLE